MAVPVVTSQMLMVRPSLSGLASSLPDGLMIGSCRSPKAGMPPGITAREPSSWLCRCRHSQSRCSSAPSSRARRAVLLFWSCKAAAAAAMLEPIPLPAFARRRPAPPVAATLDRVT